MPSTRRLIKIDDAVWAAVRASATARGVDVCAVVETALRGVGLEKGPSHVGTDSGAEVRDVPVVRPRVSRSPQRVRRAVPTDAAQRRRRVAADDGTGVVRGVASGDPVDLAPAQPSDPVSASAPAAVTKAAIEAAVEAVAPGTIRTAGQLTRESIAALPPDTILTDVRWVPSVDSGVDPDFGF